MKKSILTLIAMALALGACAESVSPEMAMAVANAWVLRNGKFDSGRAATGQVITVRDTNSARTVLWHQVSMSGDGCVIVAPVTEIEPVVVALDNDPGELPAAHPLRGILTGDMRQRLQFLGLYPKEATLQSVKPGAASAADDEQRTVAAEWAAQQQRKWTRLGVGKGAALRAGESVGRDTVEQEVCVVKGFERNGPLTHWNQSNGGGGYCYNYYTPEHCVCGCVATACSAIVQFFGAKESAEGIAGDCTYNGERYPCSTKGGEIDWSLFANCKKRKDYDHLTSEQRMLLGRVAYDAGVGVNMSWAPGGSGAYEMDIVTALKDVFGFKYARYVGFNNPTRPGEDNLRKLIYGQCAAGAPVGMSIEGHSVVAVGYGIDNQEVERVRVFMGWGGSGDGWYALPLIDTKAVEGGGTYLSKVVDGVVTMINYDSSDIVPVVGQANMPGFDVIFNDVLSWQDVMEDQEVVDEATGLVTTNQVQVRKLLPRAVKTDDNGWFATRVPPNAGPHTFSIVGKVGEYTIGPAAMNSTAANRLTPALPDWFTPFPLLNSTVAFSFESAVRLALEEDKAILRVSGSSGETNTQCVLNYIFNLDDQNVNDFTNRFVYFYTGFASTNGDMRPSYSVLLPQAAHAEERWYFSNGRLSYGYGRRTPTDEEVTVTNVVVELEITDDPDDPEVAVTNVITTTNIVVALSTNVVISTYAPTGSTPDYKEFLAWPTFDDAARVAYEWSVDEVLAQGWEEYTKRAPDISLTVNSVVEDAQGMEELRAGEPMPGWGLHSECYKTGEVVVATAPVGEVTNQTAGVVLGCTGYTLECENGVTGQSYELEGDTTTVTLPAMEKGDHFTLTWKLGVKAVYIDINVSPKSSAGTTEPGSGWYQYGKPVVFTAKPTMSSRYGWSVERWNGRNENLPEGVSLGGPGCPSVYVVPTVKTELDIAFRQLEDDAFKNFGKDGTNYNVEVVAYLLIKNVQGGIEFAQEIPTPDFATITLSGDSSIAGKTLKSGAVSSLTNLVSGMLVSPAIVGASVPNYEIFNEAWKCTDWCFYDEDTDVDAALQHDGAVGRLIPTLWELSKSTGEEPIALDGGDAPFFGFKPKQNGKLVLFWVYSPEEDVPTAEEFKVEINWNDALDNLHSGEYLLLPAETVKQLLPETEVTVGEPPLGWKIDGPVKKVNGNLVVPLALDEKVLTPKGAAETPPLNIFYNDDGTLTVKADIANGVKGFWYSLFTADELKGPWTVVQSGYEAGKPVVQVTSEIVEGDVGPFTLEIVVNPEVAKRFYKLVVSEKDPSKE